jgi:hypothetical protein
MGQIANTDGTLSGTLTQQGGSSSYTSCGRALTVSNNVVIDVKTCGFDPSDPGAAAVAKKIAAKTPTK